MGTLRTEARLGCGQEPGGSEEVARAETSALENRFLNRDLSDQLRETVGVRAGGQPEASRTRGRTREAQIRVSTHLSHSES